MKYKIGDKFLNELEITEINQEKAAPYFLSGGQGVGWWSEAALMDLRKYITGGWVPVEKQLPDEDGEYLVCLSDGMIDTEPFENGRWYFYQDVPIGIIAWMPLPEPYNPD